MLRTRGRYMLTSILFYLGNLSDPCFLKTSTNQRSRSNKTHKWRHWRNQTMPARTHSWTHNYTETFAFWTWHTSRIVAKCDLILPTKLQWKTLFVSTTQDKRIDRTTPLNNNNMQKRYWWNAQPNSWHIKKTTWTRPKTTQNFILISTHPHFPCLVKGVQKC